MIWHNEDFSQTHCKHTDLKIGLKSGGVKGKIKLDLGAGTRHQSITKKVVLVC